MTDDYDDKGIGFSVTTAVNLLIPKYESECDQFASCEKRQCILKDSYCIQFFFAWLFKITNLVVVEEDQCLKINGR